MKEIQLTQGKVTLVDRSQVWPKAGDCESPIRGFKSHRPTKPLNTA